MQPHPCSNPQQQLIPHGVAYSYRHITFCRELSAESTVADASLSFNRQELWGEGGRHTKCANKGLRPNQCSWVFLALGVMGSLLVLPPFLLAHNPGIALTLEHNIKVRLWIITGNTLPGKHDKVIPPGVDVWRFNTFEDAVAFFYSP